MRGGETSNLHDIYFYEHLIVNGSRVTNNKRMDDVPFRDAQTISQKKICRCGVVGATD